MTDGNHEASDIHSRHVLPLYARINELEEQLREAKAQTYCQICGSILGGDGLWQAMWEENERLRRDLMTVLEIMGSVTDYRKAIAVSGIRARAVSEIRARLAGESNHVTD